MSGTDRAAVVAGVGAWVPPAVVTNEALAERLDTSDEWIRSRTGIRRRHVIAPGGATSDLAVEAGRRALESAGADDADVVVVATSTPDRPCPATAPEVASRLGLTGVAAFDVAAVCTGFVYALGVAGGMIASGFARTALVIGADTFSTILDPLDRTTRAIFGDGAGAVFLRAGRPTEPGALMGLRLGSDGTRSELIEVKAGGSRQRSTGLPARDRDTYFRMEGRPVFAHAVRRMATSVRATAAEVGWAPADIHRVVLHQANARILAAVAEQIDVPAECFPSNIDRVGNTVAASVPLVLADACVSGELSPGQRIVLGGFGGGLTWGSVALVWPDVTAIRSDAAPVSPSPTDY
ncbi:beta-ketoacyl-ACP synthase III [Streptomyces sp. TRM49041]|uniref:beta-ketoacyl-ACP synthase III n=1 Tax=Streptomyces sp. TRM49041 TaxID=2603216 RepID=UPI0011EC5F8F|nr:beta-ketoacyl-ACP synthase III [Streptomyces sp. TRM49041]